MVNPSELSRPLTSDEVAALPSQADPDAETATTSLVDLTSQSTAEAHLPGVASSAPIATEYDTVPDPAPFEEN